MTAQRSVMKILAHKIYCSGEVYDLSVVTIEDNRVTDISPFESETEATRFISGAVRIVQSADGVSIRPVVPDEEIDDL